MLSFGCPQLAGRSGPRAADCIPVLTGTISQHRNTAPTRGAQSAALASRGSLLSTQHRGSHIAYCYPTAKPARAPIDLNGWRVAGALWLWRRSLLLTSYLFACLLFGGLGLLAS